MQSQSIRFHRRFLLLTAIALIGLQMPVSAAEPTIPKQGPDAPTSQSAKPGKSLNSLLRKIRKKHKVVSLVGIATSGDDILGSGAAGYRKARSKARVTIDDAYHIGSCTKSMTATLCGILVDQGKLRWSTTIGEVFPDLQEGFNEKFRGVTLEQLLCHRSGLPEDRRPDLTIFPKLLMLEGEMSAQRTEMVKIVLGQIPAADPGSVYAYSNHGFAIAGAMCEKVMGEPYETLMKRLLFEPLGMKSAGFGAPGSPGKIDQPWGHTTLLGITTSIAPRESGSDNPAVLAPCGTAHVSLPDWARYAQLHLNAANGKASLLKPETFKKLHSDPYDQDYGFGWAIVKRDWADGKVLAHDGSNGRWYASIIIAPEKNFAVMTATNLANEEAIQACHEAGAAIRDRFISPASPRK